MLDRVTVRGKREPLEIYEFIWQDSTEELTMMGTGLPEERVPRLRLAYGDRLLWFDGAGAGQVVLLQLRRRVGHVEPGDPPDRGLQVVEAALGHPAPRSRRAGTSSTSTPARAARPPTPRWSSAMATRSSTACPVRWRSKLSESARRP